MDQSNLSRRDGPLAFFDFAYHYGGSFTGTVTLVRAMQRLTDVAVIDAYGTCENYVADLVAADCAPVVLFPDRVEGNTIGGRSMAQRLARMALSVPHMVAVVSRLRRKLEQLQPRALWVNSEKALFVAWLAAPAHLPIAVMIRTEMQRTRPYCALAWRRANAAIAVSRNTLNQFCSTGCSSTRRHVVHDGIDVERTIERSRPEPEPADLGRSAPDSLCLAFPATLAGPLKGHETGIRAFARLIHSRAKADLWLCGDVPPNVSPAFYNSMRQLVVELGVQEHVHFVGYRHDIESVMARSDVVLLPSHTEGLPRSLMEAMALAKPVIATKVGGIPELVRDGIDGILVDPGDVEGLTVAFRVLSDPLFRQQMGRAGQRRVRARFSLHRQAQEFTAILDAMACGAIGADPLPSPQMRIG